MKTKDLAMINFVESKLKGKVMIRYVYDDNINQQVTLITKHIPLKRKKSYTNLILSVYPNLFKEGKVNGVYSLINTKILDRLLCNLNHL